MSSQKSSEFSHSSNFELIEVKLDGIRHRVTKISEWLWIVKCGEHYKVYRSDTQKPLIDIRLATLHDAEEFSEWINTQYAQFFPIWHSYPEADIFSLAKWTVRNGIKVHEMLKILQEVGRKKVVALDDVNTAYNNADERKWQQLTFLTN
jgi:hypothetical protein